MDWSGISSLFPPEPTVDDLDGEQEHHDYIIKAREMAAEWIELYEQDGWKVKKKTEEATLWSMPTKNSGINTLKRHMVVNAPIQKVLEFFTNESSIRKVNNKWLKNEYIEFINEESKFAYREYEGALIVANRDLAAFIHQINLSDGNKIIVSFSVDHEDIPLNPKNVRAEVQIYFLYLKAVSQDVTEVLSVIRVDPKGSIPAFFTNLMSGLQHEEFVITKKLIEE